jgi:hypothetical protein
MNHIIPRLIPRNQYIYNHIEKLYKKNIFIIWKKISISEWYDTFNNHTTTWLLFSLKNELLLYMTYHIYIFKEKLLKSTRKLNTSIQKKKKHSLAKPNHYTFLQPVFPTLLCGFDFALSHLKNNSSTILYHCNDTNPNT